MAAAGSLDIYIDQGGEWEPVWYWLNDDDTPVQIAAMAARLQIRATYAATTTLVSLTKGNGITLANDGSIRPFLSAAATAALLYTVNADALPNFAIGGRQAYQIGFWDLLLNDDKILAGNVFLFPGVTR